MALQIHTVDVPINGGLDTKGSPNILSPPVLTRADNVVYQTTGALRKRYGFNALTTAISGGGNISVTNGKAIQNVNGELTFVDGSSYYSWSPQLNQWIYRGIDSLPGLALNEMSNSGSSMSTVSSFGNISFADIGNYRCVTFTGNAENVPTPTAPTQNGQSDLWCGLWDISRNTWLVVPANYFNVAGAISNTNLQYTSRVMCTAFGNYFYVFGRGLSNTGAAIAFGWTFNPASVAATVASGTNTILTLANGVTLVGGVYTTSAGTNIGANLYLDAYANNNALFVAVGPNGWNGSCSVFSFLTSGATVATLAISTTPAPYRHSISVATTVGMLTAYSPGGVGSNYVFLQPFLPTTPYNLGSPTNLSSSFVDPLNWVGSAPGTVVSGQTQFAIVSQRLVSSTVSQDPVSGYIYQYTNYNSGSFYSNFFYNTTNFQQNVYPISKPLYVPQYNDWVMWVETVGQVYTTVQPTAFLLTLQNAQILGRGIYDSGQVYSLFTTPGSVNFFSQPQTNFAIPVVAGQVLESLSVATSAPKIIAPLAQGALVSGARPTYYDGVVTLEAGFDSYPEIVTPTAIATTNGTLTNNTTYFYTAIYRRYDNAGRVLYSSPAPVVAVSIPASGTYWTQFAINATTCWPQYTQNPGFSGISPLYNYYQAIIYRTTKADTIDFREVGIFPKYGVGTAVYDNIDDTTLTNENKPFLYAPPSGGELSNDPPIAFSMAVSSQDKIFTNSTEYPYRVYWSKPFSSSRGPEFNAESFLEIDPPSGPITGLGYMDNVLYIFKAYNIFALGGAGPNANGSGQFNPVNKITTNSGAINPTSIIVTDLGIFYQSQRGIEVLTRGVTSQYVGAPVEGFLGTATVTAALNIPANSQVRFWLSTGQVLVYDYYLQKWSTFSSVNGYYATSACLWNGTQVTLDTVNGNIDVETTTFTDNGATVAMTIETPWIKFEHAQSWNRLRRVSVLGDYKSTSTASLYFAYDWNNTYQDTINFSTGSGLTTIDTVYQWQARAPRQVMQAVRLKLVDTTITGESYDITNFALEYAVKGGIAKLPDRKAK